MQQRRYARRDDVEEDEYEAPPVTFIQVKDAFGFGFSFAAGMFVFNALLVALGLGAYLLLR